MAQRWVRFTAEHTHRHADDPLTVTVYRAGMVRLVDAALAAEAVGKGRAVASRKPLAIKPDGDDGETA